MAIRIIEQDEKRTFELKGGKIFYRPIPRRKMKEFVQSATRRGVTDWQKVTDLALEYAIIDWSGFVDGDGKQVPYSREMIDSIPMGFLNEFTETLLDDTRVEDEIKNSGPSSGKR